MTSPANPHLATPALRLGPAPAAARLGCVLLHGRAQPPQTMVEVAARLALPDLACVIPVAAEHTWYPLGFMQPLAGNEPWLTQALAAVEATVAQLVAQGLARDRIAVLGFSQGACLALQYVLTHPARYAGIVAWTGGLPGPAGCDWTPAGRYAGMPVYLSNADADAWVPMTRTIDTARVFAQAGATVTLQIFPGMEHVVTEAALAAARALLTAA